MLILGKIVGRSTTNQITFKVEKEVDKFEYVQINHKNYGFVLGQIIEIEKDSDKTIATCNIIGYKDEEDSRVKPIRLPFETGTEVLIAEDEFIKSVININLDNGAYIGKLDGKDININLDLNKLLTKHVCVLAKSGAGKSYTVGVLLEEILEKKIPLLIIDPHGEYSTLKYPNDNQKDIESLNKFGLTGKGYISQIREFKEGERELKLSNNISSEELLHILPAKLSNAQQGLLYSAIKDMDSFDFESLILELEMVESNSKWAVINVIDYLRKMKIFSPNYTSYNELIQSGICTLLNMKGINPEIQEILVYKVLTDLFELRKINKIPPFFLVIEEAHNYCPERGFGETKSSKIIRTIASEGRKFGLGLCVISQRPARVDKSVISQCSTQLILKVTNPNDVKAITNSVEGITSNTEAEISNLPIGSAMVCGVTDLPLFVNVRPRKSKHGGEAVNILDQPESDNFLENVEEFNDLDMLPLLFPTTSKKDYELMAEEGVIVKTMLVPGVKVLCKSNGFEFNLLFEKMTGNLVTNLDERKTLKFPNFSLFEFDEISAMKKLVDSDGSMSVLSASDIENLKKKQVIKFDGNINDNLNFMFNIKNYATYSEVDFKKIDFDTKYDERISSIEVSERIKPVLDVKDSNDVYLVFYESSKV